MTVEPLDENRDPIVDDRAIVHPKAELEQGVLVGPWAIIEAHAHIGRGSIIGPRAYVGPYTTLGARNRLYIGAILGQDAQDRSYKGEVSRLITGADCIFRENAVMHRGSREGLATIIGDRGYFMHQAHVGHDGKLGDDVTLGPNCLLAGHVTIDDQAVLSGNTAVHQHCRVGRLAFIRGQAGVSVNLPPFCISAGENNLRGLNVVGMRRAGHGPDDRRAVQKAFKELFWVRRPMSASCDAIEADYADRGEDVHPMVAEMLDFIRNSPRGVVRFRNPSDRTAAEGIETK